MKKIDIYYTNFENKYGFVIEERNGIGARNKENKLLAFGSGESSYSMLRACHDILTIVKDLKEKNIIGEEDSIYFFNKEYNESRYITKEKVNIDALPINIYQKDILKSVRELRENISKKSKINTTLIGKNSVDGVSFLKLDMIELHIKNNKIDNIPNIYNQEEKAKYIEIKNSDGTDIKVEVKKSKAERKEEAKKLLKRKKRLAYAKRKAYRDSDEYKNFLSSLIDTEMANDRVLKTSQVTIQQEYNLEAINSLLIYTDGSISEGKEKGSFIQGYGVSILDNNTKKPLFKFKGRFTDSSNELQHIEIVESYAIYRALLFIDNKMANNEINNNAKITIRTDSQNSIDNLKKYQNGNNNILGLNIIKEIDRLASDKRFKIDWVKGHSTDVNNKEVDRLARQGSKAKTADEYITFDSIKKSSEPQVEKEEPVKTKEIKKEVIISEVKPDTTTNDWRIYFSNIGTISGFVLKNGNKIIEAGKFDITVNSDEIKSAAVIEAFRCLSRYLEKEDFKEKEPLIKFYSNKNYFIDYILSNKIDHSITKDSNLKKLLNVTKEERRSIGKKYSLRMSKNSIKGHEHILDQINECLSDPNIPHKSFCGDLNLNIESNKVYVNTLDKALNKVREDTNVISFNKAVEEMNELMEETKHIQPNIKRLTM